MQRLHPVRIGLALAITAGVLSLACAALVAMAPGTMVALFQTWWHGIDITRLAVTPPPMDARSLAIGVVTLMLSAFTAGWLFGAVYNLLAGHRAAVLPSTRAPTTP